MRETQQERQQHIVGNERRAAVADKRQRDAGEWHYSQDTTHDDECLDPQECGEPDGEELVGVFRFRPALLHRVSVCQCGDWRIGGHRVGRQDQELRR